MKMNILIINTAFDNADYSLYNGEDIKLIKTDSNAKHSETSLVNVDTLLNEAGIRVVDLDVIAVNLGPGSFTGIRIGVALVKGFASACDNVKLIGFNSFEPLISRLNGDGYIYIQTSKNDYYTAKINGGQIVQTLCKNEINENENYVCVKEKDLSYTENELTTMINSKIARGEFLSANELEPLYLKLSQAEQDFINKQNSNN